MVVQHWMTESESTWDAQIFRVECEKDKKNEHL